MVFKIYREIAYLYTIDDVGRWRLIMRPNKYAIVIVTYNRRQLLEECVEKAYRQTTPAQSIIIINNASTDGTRAYLKELAAESTIYDIINLSQNIGGAGGFSDSPGTGGWCGTALPVRLRLRRTDPPPPRQSLIRLPDTVP